MKTIRKSLLWLLVFCLTFITVFGTGVSAQAASQKKIKTVSVKVAGKKVNGTTVSLKKGKSMAMKVSISPKLSKKTISFKSSKPSVVSVSKKGKLTAKKAGTSNISVAVKSAGYKKKTVTVNVKVPGTGNSKALVVYFSCTNTTKGVAQKIADVTNADLYAIKAKQPYTKADLDYSPSRSAREQSDPSARPVIAGKVKNFSSYDVIYLGFPIWNDEEPRIIDTFLESYNFSGKTVVPFCTSGGSGISIGVSNIKKLVPSSTTVLKGRRFSGSVSEAEVKEWVNGLGL